MSLTEAEREMLLAFADDEHLMGQRHTEWIGVAPFLEEDLAFSSIAQDELGHATALYALLLAEVGTEPGTDLDVDDAAVDAFAFGRSRDEWRSSWLVEQPCTDWAEALVRHWLYDTAEQLRWQQLATSTDPMVRALAERAEREEQYHRRHAAALLDGIAGDPEADRRVADAAARLIPLADALFDAGPIVVWRELVDRRFGVQDWAMIEAGHPPARTERSEHFDEVYARMREVFDLDPTATW